MKHIAPCQINIKRKDILEIHVNTERLNIRSINMSDQDNYIKLLSDAHVMKSYAWGHAYEPEKTKDILKMWIDKWKNHDPYGGYAIFEKKSQKFIGTLSIKSWCAGECKLAYILHSEFWGKSYGSEAAQAIIKSLVPILMELGYKTFYKVPLKKISATAREDNLSSKSILKRCGFKTKELVYEFGALRSAYEISAKLLKNNYFHFFDYPKCPLQQLKDFIDFDDGVDISAIEMSGSSFGIKDV